MDQTRIFFSWQSDRPKTRQFVRKALDVAVERIKQPGGIEEPVRIDEDAAGLAGSPNIPQAIFEKIDNATIFVADVTIVAVGADGSRRSCPNPNVMVELGYAVARHGWERVLLLMNEAFGPVKDLPFDIDRHRVTCFTYTEADGTDHPTDGSVPLWEALRKGIQAILEEQDPEIASFKSGLASLLVDVRLWANEESKRRMSSCREQFAHSGESAQRLSTTAGAHRTGAVAELEAFRDRLNEAARFTRTSGMKHRWLDQVESVVAQAKGLWTKHFQGWTPSFDNLTEFRRAIDAEARMLDSLQRRLTSMKEERQYGGVDDVVREGARACAVVLRVSYFVEASAPHFAEAIRPLAEAVHISEERLNLNVESGEHGVLKKFEPLEQNVPLLLRLMRDWIAARNKQATAEPAAGASVTTG